MTQIIIIPRRGHFLDHDVTGAVLKLREAGIQSEQRKTLNRIDERGVILIQSDSDHERALDIVRNMGLQAQ